MNWRWKYFSPDEMRCKCGCGRADMDPDFMDALEALREAYGAPIIVTSGFRCPEYNAKVSSTGLTGPHTTGKAADVHVEDPVKLLRGALFVFTGVGIKWKGPWKSRFVHLDMVRERPTLWTY